MREILSEPADDLGYIGDLCRDGERVWAVGGTHGRATVLVWDQASKGFEKRAAPKINGVRKALVVDGKLLVCGEGGGLFASADGERWTKLETGTSACLFALVRDRKSHVWLAGEDGYVRRSKDACASWSAVALGTRVRVNAIEQIGGALYFGMHDGTIVRYRRDRIDHLALDAGAPICGLVGTRAGSVLVCGDRGALYRSEDGATFAQIPCPKVDLEAIAELEDGSVVVAGDRGTVLLSRDDGRSFERLEHGLEGHLWSLSLAPGGVLIGGDRGLVARVAVEAAGL